MFIIRISRRNKEPVCIYTKTKEKQEVVNNYMNHLMTNTFNNIIAISQGEDKTL